MVSNLDLTQLATFRLEAADELVEAGPELTRHALALADYTNTTVFVPDLDADGNEVTPSWFGLDPTHEEDSAEEIASAMRAITTASSRRTKMTRRRV